MADTENQLFNYGVQQWGEEPDVAFDSFLTGYRFNNRRLRASSFAVYKGMFKRLRDWAQVHGLSLFDIKEPAIEQFLAGRKLSAETRHRYLLLFTTLFEHLAQVRARESSFTTLQSPNPARMLLLEQEAPSRDDPEFLNEAETQRFIAALSAGTDWKSVRDRAMALLILGAGLRSSEVLALKISDLQVKSGELDGIWVHAQKPRPARQVPIHHWARPYIDAWLRERQVLTNGAAPSSRASERRLVGPLLFPATLAGAQFKPVKLFRVVKTALKEAGISKRYEGPTLLRNSCGANWLQKHEPLQVSVWLGHARVRTTELLLPPERRSRQEEPVRALR